MDGKTICLSLSPVVVAKDLMLRYHRPVIIRIVCVAVAARARF